MAPASIFVLAILVLLMLLTLVKMLKYRKSHFWISSLVGSLIFSFFFTLSSLFWTTDIAFDTETIQHLEFGWPISFIIQDQSRYEPPFPYEMNFGYEMYTYLSEYKTEYITIKNFYLSLFINFLGALFIWLIIHNYLNTSKGNSLLEITEIIKSKYRNRFSLFNKIIGSILFAFLFTVSSSFWMTNITYETESIKHSKFGWPIPYKIEKQIRLEPLPHEMGFIYQTSGFTVEKNFYLSLFINFFGVLLIWTLVSYYLIRYERFNNLQN